MADMFDKAYQLKGQGHHKIWLVWTIGTYANGCPWVELRAVYTNVRRAHGIADAIRDYEIPQQSKRGPQMNRVHVEKRVTNHKYGGEMMEVAAVRGKI